MLKSVQIFAVVLLSMAAWLLLPMPSQHVIAQSAPLFISAVDLDIAPVDIEKFKEALKENGAASVKEPGCRQFDIMVLASNQNHIFIYEVYDNEAAAQAHRTTDHFKKYAATTASMVVKREVRAMMSVALNSKAR